jgi:FKBP-type peptidyl-prolyl cis-trans isomerase FkpA
VIPSLRESAPEHIQGADERRKESMRRFATILMLITGLAVAVGCKGAGSAAPASTGELKSDEEKTIYAMGVMLGGNVKPMALSAEQLAILSRGMLDSASGKQPLVDPQAMATQIQEFARARAAAGAVAEKKKSEDFMVQAAKAPGAVKTETGLVYQAIKPGTGDSPKPTDTVKVHYTGSLIDGTVFDSSVQRGQPAEFPLNGVIPCWTQGLQKMKMGEKAKLICPSDLAYGDQGRPPKIPGGATLVFEVELLEIKK